MSSRPQRAVKRKAVAVVEAKESLNKQFSKKRGKAESKSAPPSGEENPRCTQSFVKKTEQESLQGAGLQLQAVNVPANTLVIENTDGMLGVWIKDVFYELRRFTNGRVTRNYLQDVSTVNVPTEVQSLFQQVDPRFDLPHSRMYYRNGRHFYFIKGRTELVVPKFQIVPNMCTNPGVLLETNGWQPLYQLICKGFRGVTRAHILHGLGLHCTMYGGKRGDCREWTMFYRDQERLHSNDNAAEGNLDV